MSPRRLLRGRSAARSVRSAAGSVRSVAALALALAACGPRPPPQAPAPSSPPAAAVDLESLCPTADVGAYQVRRGEAPGTNAGEALAAARARAADTLQRAACVGVSELRCASVLRHIKPWRDGWYDPQGAWACASVSVDKAQVDGLARDAAVFESKLRELAAATAAQAGQAPVQVRAPTWASGCSSGPLGQAIEAALFNQLAAYPELRLVPADERADQAARLTLTLAPTATEVQLAALFARPREASQSPLPGFGFPPDLFQIAPDESGFCRSDLELGLVDGRRVGAGGLRVQIEVPGVDGQACEGAQAEPVVTVNRPADVQVFSVAQTGRSMLIWPPPGVSPRVEGSIALGAMTSVANPTTGDERLVAVALPVGARGGPIRGWTGFCEVQGGLSPALYPEDAAVGTATFTVVPEGTADCAPVPGLAAAKQAMVAPPTCGG